MKRLIGLAMSLAVLATAVWAFAPRPLPPFPATALRPDGLQINGIARAGERLVAVGERGRILFSDDQGRDWRVAAVDKPQGATLTQVAFADTRHGIAVGHSGLILRTEDGGTHWQQVAFDAQSSDPLLGALAQRNGPWFAVGSFGKFLVSSDQGRHWEEAARNVNPAMQDRHLNAIAGDGQGRLMLVGEAGLVLRSTDGGSRWEPVKTPYEGSLYGVLPLRDGAWLAFGMRGNALRSDDFGTTWQAAETGLRTSFFGGAELPDGRIVLAGQGGTLVLSADGGRHFAPLPAGSPQTLAALVPAARDKLALGGSSGLAGATLAANR